MSDPTGGGLNLDTAGAQASVKSISGIVNEMQAILGTIQKQTAAGQETWFGRASEAFGTTNADWHTSATKLQAVLQEIENALMSGFTEYEDIDSSAAQPFQNQVHVKI
ncbi:WXG100 family type VII secretion target [Gordonia sp. LSe1-13]|uniref:ESAT-6-like protein n=1 Tax=Gordonia sesuvii TaxID=3116777 RepID=A0ABU7MDQ6_9ACTN|nr:WXG100 family type VII secretion target [Gordonia sp. LSe1-13]